MNENIKISNISDLEGIFHRIKDGEDIDIKTVDFELFQEVNFKIYGDPNRYNGTLPASLAQGLCEFQNEISKVFSIIRYKTDNLQKLTSKDKEDIEIVFSINEGCTDVVAAFKDLFEAFGNAFEKVTHGMSSSQKTLCFLFAVTVIGGAWVGTSYLDHKSEIDEKKLDVDQQQQTLQSENQRLTILKDGMLDAIREKASVDAVERAEGIQEHTAKAYTGILKGASDADKIIITGASTVDLSQKDIHELIKNPIERAKTEERTIDVSIESIKRSSPDKLSVSCKEASEDSSFTVSVDTSFIDDKDEIALLFDAMKENKTVKIKGSYKVRAGVIEQGNASAISNA